MTILEEKIAHLNQVILDYIAIADRGYVQGSDEWKAIRGTTIGGSEQSTIEGSNKHSGVLDLIRSKLGLVPFPDTIFTKWGNMFEEVITKYVEIDRNTKILGGEAFLKGRFPTQSYSPDGIAVVVYDGEPEIVLFEFKCPFMRKITGVIPVYYKPQIMAGMDTIRLMKRAIFTEAKFRRCSIADLGPNPSYDKLLWPWDKYSPENPLAYGYILLAFTSNGLNRNSYAVESIKNSIKNLANLYKAENLVAWVNETTKNGNTLFNVSNVLADITDLGCCTEATIKQIFNLYSSGVLEPIYAPIKILAKEGELEPISDYVEKNCADRIIIGVLPYKLFTCCYTEELAVIGYLDKYKDMIDETIKCVSDCRLNPDKREEIIAKFASDHNICETIDVPVAPPLKEIEKKPNSDLLAKIAALKAAKK